MKQVFLKLKYLLFYLLAAFAKLPKISEKVSVEHEDRLQAILSDRTEEKRIAYREWSKPENIAIRMEELEKKAPIVLARAKEMSRLARLELGLPPEDPPLPPMSELTEEMRRQQPSMIRIMLKDSGWEYCWDMRMWLKKTV